MVNLNGMIKTCIMEVWKDIKGYEGLYQISNYGRVKSLAQKYAGKRPQGRQKDYDAILNPMDSGKGYKYISLCVDGKRKNRHLHRLVAEHFIDNPNCKEQVNHIDGNKANNHIDNLEWVTLKENMIHASEIGLLPKGEKSHKAKLTEKEVREIRLLHETKQAGRKSLCRAYQITPASLHRVIHKQSWKHI